MHVEIDTDDPPSYQVPEKYNNGKERGTHKQAQKWILLQHSQLTIKKLIWLEGQFPTDQQVYHIKVRCHYKVHCHYKVRCHYLPSCRNTAEQDQLFQELIGGECNLFHSVLLIQPASAVAEQVFFTIVLLVLLPGIFLILVWGSVRGMIGELLSGNCPWRRFACSVIDFWDFCSIV